MFEGLGRRRGDRACDGLNVDVVFEKLAGDSAALGACGTAYEN